MAGRGLDDAAWARLPEDRGALETAAGGIEHARRDPGERRNPVTRALAAVQDLGHAKGSRGSLRASYVRDRMASADRSPLNMIDVERDFRRLSDDDALRTVNAAVEPGNQPGEAHFSLTVAPQPRLDVYAMVASSRTPSIGGIRYSGGAVLRNVLFSAAMSSASTAAKPVAWPTARWTIRTHFLPALDEARSPRQHRRRGGPGTRLCWRWASALQNRSFDASLVQRLLDQPLTPPAGGKGCASGAAAGGGAPLHHPAHPRPRWMGRPSPFSPGSVNGTTNLNVIRGEVSYVRRTEDSVLAVSVDGSVGLSGTGSDLPRASSGPTPISPRPWATRQLSPSSSASAALGRGGVQGRSGRADLRRATLYASEQFSAGGDTVRGYRQNDLLADEGVRGTLELYCPIGFGHGLCDARATDWKSVKLSVFADGAYMYNHLGAQPAPSTIGSLGVALAWNPTPSSTVELSYGPFKLPEHRTGPLDFQDRGLRQFSVTVHPLAPFEPD